MKSAYSTTPVSDQLLQEIKKNLDNLDYGSLEIYVVGREVTQITKRQIQKTNNNHNGK